MITIRLQRRGRKNDPSFRVIVVDSHRAAKTGNYLEMVGSYDPRTNRVELDGERIKHWMDHGATVSGTVHNLLVSNKILDGKKINVLPRKSPPVKEEAPAPETAAPETADAPATDAAVEEESKAPSAEALAPEPEKPAENAVPAEEEVKTAE